MPQLNPTPWFSIMVTSWFIFSFILQPKISQFTSTNQPSNKTFSATKAPSWNWPWT
uniref:ATP synthase complex subunit 8 n=1 Tax=Cnemotriccus fuscatus TaxID=183540 RepID=Q1RNA6_9TYRA|nr:ATP synthase F0 subunit 8 [Cnemotriccus fuscatus]AAT46110.1 ATP synthase subunit 8 [Cnemotriccus fuscatus]